MAKTSSSTRPSRAERRLIERVRADALREAAALVILFGKSSPWTIREKILTLVPESQRDGCSNCHGLRGGIPGNENVIDGKFYCDYCDSELFPPLKCPHENEQ